MSIAGGKSGLFILVSSEEPIFGLENCGLRGAAGLVRWVPKVAMNFLSRPIIDS